MSLVVLSGSGANIVNTFNGAFEVIQFTTCLLLSDLSISI